MDIREQRREAAVERMADHLLDKGMAGASLRPLAAAAGTSDRMLLYYFADKDELLAVTLERIAGRLRSALDAALPVGVRLPYAALLNALWSAVGSPGLAPYMRLWLELAAGAARGREPERTVAGAILEGFVTWVRDHLDADRQAGGDRAALLLATLEGLLLLDAAGRRDLAEAARGIAVE
jgi:AcrR family transcriptional regulator